MCTAPFFLIFLQYSEKAAQSAAESVGKFESCRGFFVLIYVLAQAAPRGADFCRGRRPRRPAIGETAPTF
jgi:hypothetical protein